ncbi:MAG: hypothetical protein E3J73_08135 [Candidatus Bathyarchaeum sp.]|nr:MAG: hypothetical protein E3J73_08135 [Candidatus Bathyarchaeum sp.]
MSEEAKEKKERLTDAEIEEIFGKGYQQMRNWHPSEEEKQKLRNTVEMLEADLKSTKGLKRFIEPGVLVNDRLIIFSKSDEYQYNISLRAFEGGEYRVAGAQVVVALTVAEANRLRRLLPQVIKCAKAKRRLIKLKEVVKEKAKPRGYRGY